jgi:hypothetical protein
MFKTHYVMTDPGDRILCENLESLMARQQLPAGMPTAQYLYIEEMTRQNFYQEAIPRVPRVIQYIFQTDLDTDKDAQGLDFGIKKLLVYDGNFLNTLMTYLAQPNISQDGIAAVGAYMVRIISDYAAAHPEEDSKGKKADKEKKSAEPDAELEGINRINSKLGILLSNLVDKVNINCPGLTEREALSVAAALAMQNQYTIPQLIQSNLPITASLLDIIRTGRNNEAFSVVIASAFLLEKKDYPKLTENQEKFIDSLSQYVYKLVNEKSETEIFSFLTCVYDTMDGRNVKLENYIIDPRACGTQNGRFHATAKHLFPAKK